MQLKKTVVALLSVVAIAGSTGGSAEAVNRPVDQNIFQWVQSSSRMGYYFNQQQICYKVVNSEIDLDTLLVPVLRTYDPVQVKDTVDKRRWHMQSTHGFEDLAGRSEYAEINIPTRTVKIHQANYIDSTWTTIETVDPNITLRLDDMSNKNLEKIFFMSILDYAQRNQLELALRTRSDLTSDVKSHLAKKQQDYIDARDPAIDEEVKAEWNRLVDEGLPKGQKKKSKKK